MSATNAAVAIYDTHSQAEEAVKELQRLLLTWLVLLFLLNGFCRLSTNCEF